MGDLYWQLFKEFFLIGAFSFGGGYATLPFLYDISQRYGWYSPSELSQIAALASITPGPVGINAATYAGMKVNGIISAFIATSSEILPALFIVIIISKLYKKFSDNFYVQSALYTLKPVSCALLSAAGIHLLKSDSIQTIFIILFIVLLSVSLLKKLNPLWCIGISVLYGFTCAYFHLIGTSACAEIFSTV